LRGNKKLHAVPILHDKCQEDCAATHVTRQKKERGKNKQTAQNDAAIKERRKLFSNTKEAHGDRIQKQTIPRMEKINFTRQK
jgi:hypothetical protein